MKHRGLFAKRLPAFAMVFAAWLFSATLSIARVGGAGGHGSHSSGGHSSSGHSGGGYGYSGGSGGSMSPGAIIVLLIIIVIVYVLYKKFGSSGSGNTLVDLGRAPATQIKPFPEGLDMQKVHQSFLSIQNAWQRKDLKEVRKWLSDGMYQRLSVQFKMMQQLGQSNRLSGIQVGDIHVDDLGSDGDYQTAEVAITFRMDDTFSSDKYPQFNESYAGDEDTEYWTFIKRCDAAAGKDLYSNANCPNCGAPFEQALGEISRCVNCGTLTNSAAYDWVLSEITQDEDYSGGAGLADDAGLKTLMQGDPQFAVQRVEDVASNVFMQIMQVLTGSDNQRLARFADEATAAGILALKKSALPFVFDRLYLNYVTLSGYNAANDLVQLHFDLAATYRRVRIAQGIQILDADFVTHRSRMTLSRKAAPLKADAGETVFSYECSSCGAPFTDTTDDRCAYCDALVVDTARNWVLTAFSWG